MIPRGILGKALDGGWEPKTPHNKNIDLSYQEIALDANFWQSLGKALGWQDKCADCYLWLGRENKDEYVHKMCKAGSHLDFGKVKNHPWHDAATRFYDLILTGGDVDAFWKELLKDSV